MCLNNIHGEVNNKTDLVGIIKEVKLGDIDNREAVAARLYFKALYGKSFKRYDDDVINACLNYSYAIIRSVIRQNIVRLGMEPSLGFHHASEENPFNLSDDIIECFRPIADAFIYDTIINKEICEFTTDLKRQLPYVLLEQCVINNKVYYLADAIRISCESVAACIEQDNASHLRLPQMIEGGR